MKERVKNLFCLLIMVNAMLGVPIGSNPGLLNYLGSKTYPNFVRDVEFINPDTIAIAFSDQKIRFEKITGTSPWLVPAS
jgi:hypothetical protein